MSFHLNILTLFSDAFPGVLAHSVTGRALEKSLWSFSTINLRDFATDNYKSVDDTPFGGGAGMVIKPDIIDAAVHSLSDTGRKIFLSPRGRVFNQAVAQELAREPIMTLLCGRYEGVDQRALDHHGFEEISLGDYVLSGGEIAALALIDTCVRLLPGTLGNASTLNEESFTSGLLEYPHYTKPASWTARDGSTHDVPEILASGHHARIKDWQFQQSLAITQSRRPDLWAAYTNNNKSENGIKPAAGEKNE